MIMVDITNINVRLALSGSEAAKETVMKVSEVVEGKTPPTAA